MKLKDNSNRDKGEYKMPDCDGCQHFFTVPIQYPTGTCNKHGGFCGIGQYCDDFVKRVEIKRRRIVVNGQVYYPKPNAPILEELKRQNKLKQ